MSKLKTALIFLVFLVGGIGGGTSLMRALEYFNLPDMLVTVIGLVYWCAFGMLFSKIEFKEDKRSNYDRGYADGYAAGQEEGLYSGLATSNRASREKYDEGYDTGYKNGRSDGWNQGYATAKRDMEAK